MPQNKQTNKHCQSASHKMPSYTILRRPVSGGEKLKYVPQFCIGVTGHVISPMRSDDLHWTGNFESNISKRAGDRGLLTMEHE